MAKQYIAYTFLSTSGRLKENIVSVEKETPKMLRFDGHIDFKQNFKKTDIGQVINGTITGSRVIIVPVAEAQEAMSRMKQIIRTITEAKRSQFECYLKEVDKIIGDGPNEWTDE